MTCNNYLAMIVGSKKSIWIANSNSKVEDKYALLSDKIIDRLSLISIAIPVWHVRIAGQAKAQEDLNCFYFNQYYLTFFSIDQRELTKGNKNMEATG